MTEEMKMIGAVVRSTAGRDGRRFYVIVRTDTDRSRVFISDGRLRPLERPKAKNLRHLEFVCHSREAEEMIADGALTNRSLRKLLSSYNLT